MSCTSERRSYVDECRHALDPVRAVMSDVRVASATKTLVKGHTSALSQASHTICLRSAYKSRVLNPHGRRGAATSVPQHPARGATAPPAAAGGGRQRCCSRRSEYKQWRHHGHHRQPIGEPPVYTPNLTLAPYSVLGTVLPVWLSSFLLSFLHCLVVSLQGFRTAALPPCCVAGACSSGLSREGVAALPAAADGTGAPHNAGRKPDFQFRRTSGLQGGGSVSIVCEKQRKNKRSAGNVSAKVAVGTG